jgi:TonB family protein
VRWKYLAASLLGHAVAIVCLFVLVPPARPLPRLDAISVQLVGATPAAHAAAAAPAEAKRPPLAAEPTPNRPLEKVVKLPEKKPEASEPARPAETAVEESDPVEGAPGLSAGVAVDDANFEFTYYLIALRNRIGRNWAAPAGLPGGAPVRAVAYFQIGRDGSVHGLAIEESSGHSFFDQSALRAVTISGPLPPLPLGFEGDRLGVHFAFLFEGR